jgi:type IV fimbrial biogenesis protein FimT
MFSNAPNPLPHARRPSRGFTLMELMITIALGAVLVAIGAPTMGEMLRNGRLTSSANELLAALTLARSDAVKSQVPVSVCSSNDATILLPACNNAGAGFRGYVVWQDPNTNYIVDAGETVLRRVATTPPAVNVYTGQRGALAATAYRIRYMQSGFAAVDGTRLGRVLFCDDRGYGAGAGNTNRPLRVLEVPVTGRAFTLRTYTDLPAATMAAMGSPACP